MKLVILIAIFATFCGRGHSSEHDLPSEATKRHISDYLTKFAKDRHIPCFVAGYQVYNAAQNSSSKALEHQRWTYSNGGLADIENDVKCTVDTMLRVASVSKAIGSGLVASLVEAGRLHWDDDVHKYVPESVFPKKTWNGEKVTITLRALITHLAGLRHTSAADLMHDWEFRITNSTQTVAWFAHDPLLAKPGTKFIYSNSGWSLLGAVVEAIEKRSYHLVINEYMRKIGMTHAQQDTRLQLIAHRGAQYQAKHDSHGSVKILPAPIADNLRPFPHWPAGGVISNIDDLLTYGSAMLQSYHGRAGGFLKPETVKSMWNYKPPINEGQHSVSIDGHKYAHLAHRYALGWERLDFPAEAKDASLSHLEMLYHIGAVGGANAIVVVFPQENMVFGAISNLGGVGNDLPSVAAQVYHLVKKNGGK